MVRITNFTDIAALTEFAKQNKRISPRKRKNKIKNNKKQISVNRK